MQVFGRWTPIWLNGIIVLSIDYLFVPLFFKAFGRHVVAPWRKTEMEPCKTCNEGLCCFGPSRELQQVKAELTQEREVTKALRMSLDRRVTRVETAVNATATAHTPEAKETGASLLVAASTAAMEEALESAGAGAGGAGGASKSESGRITMVMHHYVRPGMEEEYEQSINEIANFAHSRYAGHMGTTMVRPTKTFIYEGGPQAPSHYVTSFQYDTLEHMRQWMHSADRARLAEAIMRTLESEELEAQRGFSMFHSMMSPPLPGAPPPPRPPQWKSTFLAILGMTGSQECVLTWILPALLSPDAHCTAVALVDDIILCPIAVFITMPLIGALCGRWLTPAKAPTNLLMRCLSSGCIPE